MEDWYGITRSQFANEGGGYLITQYKGSPSRLIISTYPEHDWNLHQFRFLRRGTWDDIELQKETLNRIAKQLNIQKMEDWYHVTSEQICKKGAAGLIARYDGSPLRMVTSLFPNHDWDLLQFQKVSKDLWSDAGFINQFKIKLSQELNIVKMEDWYSVSRRQISGKGGGGLLQKYHNSPSKMLMFLFPEHEWKLTEFKDKPRGVTKGIWFHKEMINKLGKDLKISKMEDWYRVSARQISEQNGGGILHQYGGSPQKMVTSLFPEHDWDPMKFGRVARGTWANPASHRDFVNKLAKEFNISNMEDWYNITRTKIRKKGGLAFLIKYQYSVGKAISSVLSEHPWDISKFKSK
eukprot:TRINITY_DN3048_c0_g2_i1.p1 TRINITY_DN3048_c0_g2~~TRINITY_DN3048_c0_g2_i1.p1  ORF type:complete len:398 (-),score=57.98 TRINITY_DN3048_c0_g2_i1:17-1066(-)